MKKMNKKGFTIVELVIVIAVIGILAAVMVPTFGTVIDKANASQALSEVKSAYTITIADELATPSTEDDTIGNAVKTAAIIVKHENGKLVQINTDGSAEIVTSGDAKYEVKDGKIVAKTTDTTTGNG